MLLIAFVQPNHPEAQILLEELSQTLADITGDNGKSSYIADDFDLDRDAFVLISDVTSPLACGSLRNISADICEVKRMYSRRKGLGSEVLLNLELKAKERGYQRIVLSTRRVNTNAVNFYLKHGYKEIPPYGKYEHTNVSICFGKEV